MDIRPRSSIPIKTSATDANYIPYFKKGAYNFSLASCPHPDASIMMVPEYTLRTILMALL